MIDELHALLAMANEGRLLGKLMNEWRGKGGRHHRRDHVARQGRREREGVREPHDPADRNRGFDKESQAIAGQPDMFELWRLVHLAASGAHLPEPRLRVLDAVRMMEGHLPETAHKQALGIIGIEAVLRAAASEARASRTGIRAGPIDGSGHFAWKNIPLALIIDARLNDLADGSRLYVVTVERQRPRGPLLGIRFCDVANARNAQNAPCLAAGSAIRPRGTR